MKADTGKQFSDEGGSISQDLLLRYVNNEVSDTERRMVEKQLADDPFLWDAVEGLMMATDKSKVRQHLDYIGEQVRNIRDRREHKIYSLNNWLKAAAVFLVIIAGGWYISLLVQPDTQKIFTNEFHPYPAPVRKEASPVHSDSQVAEKEIEKKSIQEKNIPPQEVHEDENLSSEKSSDEFMVADSEVKELSAPVYDRVVVQERSELKDQPEAVSTTPAMKSPVDQKESLNNSETEVSTFKKNEKEITPAKPMNQVSQEDLSAGNVMNEKPAVENERLNAALDLYHQGKYAEAIHQFESIRNDDPHDAEANFYAGVSYLAISNPDAAIEKLKKAANDKNGVYYESSLWYEALAYVQKDKKKDAISLLEKVVDLNREYKTKAIEMLEQLR